MWGSSEKRKKGISIRSKAVTVTGSPLKKCSRDKRCGEMPFPFAEAPDAKRRALRRLRLFKMAAKNFVKGGKLLEKLCAEFYTDKSGPC